MSVKGPHRNFRMVKADKRENIIMIASEPLTFQKEDWIEVPSQTCLVITPRVCLPSSCLSQYTDMIHQNNLLKFPIEDVYFMPNPTRREGFAKAKGYRWTRDP